MYSKHRTVKVSVTTEDGELLDQFYVSHYRTVTHPWEDEENVGSPASNSLLAQRIERYVKEEWHRTEEGEN